MAHHVVGESSDVLGHCKDCRGLIAWVTSRNGKMYPVNARRFQPLNGKVEYDTHDFHSNICTGRRAGDPVAAPAIQQSMATPADLRLVQAVPQIVASLMTLITTPHIRQYLMSADPQALGQAERALIAGGIIAPRVTADVVARDRAAWGAPAPMDSEPYQVTSQVGQGGVADEGWLDEVLGETEARRLREGK